MLKTAKKAAKPFIVIDNGLRILITPSEGWYAVQGLDVRGLNTQGRTIEEAIYMAYDAARALAGAREMMAKKTARQSKEIAQSMNPPVSKRKTTRRLHGQTVGAK
jgi:predicted RNase H-like HicB family nuclease